MEWNIAQFNVARLRAPLDHPAVAEFVAALDPVNRLAEQSTGFVWRFQTEEGNATALRPYDDELVIINMSVWESLDHLANFVYRGAHASFLRRRLSWFERMFEASVVVWWTPAETLPSIDEAVERLETLRTCGPSPAAFTLRKPYPPPQPPVGTDEGKRLPR